MNFRVDTVADGDIDQAVFTSDGDCWFGAITSEWVQTGTAPAAHDDAQNFIEVWHWFFSMDQFIFLPIKRKATP
jgi:hypothetical protein